MEEMEAKNIIYGGSLSYRHMCRFNSGFFYRLDVMQKYDFYWRVEPCTQNSTIPFVRSDGSHRVLLRLVLRPIQVYAGKQQKVRVRNVLVRIRYKPPFKFSNWQRTRYRRYGRRYGTLQPAIQITSPATIQHTLWSTTPPKASTGITTSAMSRPKTPRSFLFFSVLFF
jgi:Glycolipid 2-alpha-mannosyltransferase